MGTDTIAAIATALNNTGISVIRVSGDNSISVVDLIFKSKSRKSILSKMKTHTIRYGYIYDGDNIIDEVMVSLMKSPKSYTREDIVEINCHGGIVITKKILDLVIKAGARVAEPGEYTKRAFLNGRIDLSQAEAVIDIINAKNDLALNNSISQLKGSILYKIKEIRENILRDIAFIEAALDDPEHMSLEGFSDVLMKNVENNKNKIYNMIKYYDNGRMLKEGIRTVIMGKPNVGKSSLMNVLSGDEKAIVTEIPGTTRDIIEENINFNGISINIIDTAGIRDTKDIVEKIGVEKAKKAAECADLILYVVDASMPFDENDDDIIKFISDKAAIVLFNKSDLESVINEDDIVNVTGKKVIRISAKEESGMEELYNEIFNMFFQGVINFNDEIYISNIRQKNTLYEAYISLNKVEDSILGGIPEDFYSIDLTDSYEALGKVIGESMDEDLVNMIFSEFCMGK